MIYALAVLLIFQQRTVCPGALSVRSLMEDVLSKVRISEALIFTQYSQSEVKAALPCRMPDDVVMLPSLHRRVACCQAIVPFAPT